MHNVFLITDDGVISRHFGVFSLSGFLFSWGDIFMPGNFGLDGRREFLLSDTE